MTAFTRVAIVTLGSLISFTGAADAHRHDRHAMNRHDYVRFQGRVDWQAFDRSGFAFGSQAASTGFMGKPEGSGQPDSP